MYVVYQLVNEKGKIEYVGHTSNMIKRFRVHRCKNGKFHNRKDISYEIVKSGFNTKLEALDYECKLQKELGFETDREIAKRLCKSIQKKGTECRKIKIAAYKITGEFLGIFPTIKDAANNFNLHTNLVWLVANNKQKSTKGFVFKLLENL
jgi:predicted GIY-YIG superfamily endonuclease